MSPPPCRPGCECARHVPKSPETRARISIGLQLHYAAVGLSTDPKRVADRKYQRRKRAAQARAQEGVR